MVMLALKLLRELKSNIINLAMVFSAVGLAQNLSAILALATVGFRKDTCGSPRKKYSYLCWGSGNQIDIVADKMIREGKISTSRAKEIILSIIK